MARKPTYQDGRHFIRIVRWLRESYYGRMSFNEICERLGISLRTLQRYVPVLREEFGDLLTTGQAGGQRYLVLKPLPLTFLPQLPQGNSVG